MWALNVLSLNVQVDSTVHVSPERCTSRLGHACAAAGPAFAIIILSVAASMHCWTAMGASFILISHKPALRVGNSAASVGMAERSRTVAAPNRLIRILS